MTVWLAVRLDETLGPSLKRQDNNGCHDHWRFTHGQGPYMTRDSGYALMRNSGLTSLLRQRKEVQWFGT